MPLDTNNNKGAEGFAKSGTSMVSLVYDHTTNHIS